MKKMLSVLILLNLTVLSAYCTISKESNIPVQGYYYDKTNPYANDLSLIEKYLYGKTYQNEIPSVRLNRIEKTLFNKTYSSLALAQRMNNALEAYRDDYYNKNYLTQYYTNSTPSARIRNRFIGYPTGFSPQVFMPYGINGNYATNRGYGYNNFLPANIGTGVHILN
jgi:hypothetical protein